MIEAYAGQLHSADDLIATVEQYGFLPFFRNEIPGFSVEELCPPELWFADDADGPWEWKDRQHGAANASMENYLTRKLDS